MTWILQWLLVAWSPGLRGVTSYVQAPCLLLICMDLTWIESLRPAVAVARRAPPWHLLRLPAPSWSLHIFPGWYEGSGCGKRDISNDDLIKETLVSFKGMLKN